MLRMKKEYSVILQLLKRVNTNIILFLPLVIIIVITYPTSLLSSVCIVVEGTKTDEIYSKSERKFHKSPKIAGKKCHSFSNWASAKKYLDKLKTGNKLIPREKILIFLGAHGEKDGTIHFSSGDANSIDILDDVEKFADEYHVGLVATNCYSGDILYEKLRRDYSEKTSSKKLQNLCLITSSAFKKTSTSTLAPAWIPTSLGGGHTLTSSIANVKSGENLEDVFNRNEHGGLISSAAWNEYGITRYIFKKEHLDEAELFRNLIYGAETCSVGVINESAKICAHPDVTDDIFEDILTISTSHLHKDSGKIFFDQLLRRLTSMLEDPKELILLDFSNINKTVRTDISSCYKQLHRSLLQISHPPKTQRDFCVLYSKLAKQKYASSSPYNCVDILFKYQRDFCSTIERVENIIKSEYDNMPLLANWHARIRNWQNRVKFLLNSVIAKNKHGNSKQNRCEIYSNKEKILASIFGKGFETPNDVYFGRFSFVHILEGWTRYSVQNHRPSDKNSETNDYKRKKACTDFVFW